MGAVQLAEADRLTSPISSPDKRILNDINLSASGPGIVNGVEIDSRGAPVAYHLSDDIAVGGIVTPNSTTRRFPIFDENGLQIATHCYRSTRISQHRGYSMWGPAMANAGMVDDIEFATLLKTQSSAAVAGVFEQAQGRGALPTLGPEETKTDSEGNSQIEVKLKYGAFVGLPQGVKLGSFAPAVPSNEQMQNVKHQLKKIGAAMDVPYVMLLLDASETNFSGYRGAVNTARQSWKREQQTIIDRFYSPICRWKVTQWLPSLGQVARRLAATQALFRHRFIPPGWDYIQPFEDAQADHLRLEAFLDSPRGLLARRGIDWDDLVTETVADNGSMIEAAIRTADEIRSRHPDIEISWRDILDLHKRGNISRSGLLESVERSPSPPANQ